MDKLAQKAEHNWLLTATHDQNILQGDNREKKNLTKTSDLVPKAERYWLLAAICDQSALQDGPLGTSIAFVDPASFNSIVNAMPIGIVAASDDGEQAAYAIQAGLKRLGSMREPSVIRLDDPNGVAARVLQEVIRGPLQHLALHGASLAAQLTAVRKEREQLQSNFRALEDAFVAESLSGSALLFESAPMRDPRDEGVADLLFSEGGICQTLPVGSVGVSGIALYFEAGREDGSLQVSLECIEEERVVSAWAVASRDIKVGWNYFMLPRACGIDARTLRIRVRSNDAVACAPALGNLVANPRFAAYADYPHPDLERRALAFRVYSGIPGIRPVGELNMLAAVPAEGALQRITFRVPAKALERVEYGIRPKSAIDFETVAFIQEGAQILCHPTIDGATVGVLPDIVPSGTHSVTCRVVIDHPEGKSAFVGLMVVDRSCSIAGRIAALPEVNAESPPVKEFSGWRHIEANKPLMLEVDLGEGTDGNYDIVLMSFPAEAAVDFCWLKFFDFRMTRSLGRKPFNVTAV